MEITGFSASMVASGGSVQTGDAVAASVQKKAMDIQAAQAQQETDKKINDAVGIVDQDSMKVPCLAKSRAVANACCYCYLLLEHYLICICC